MNVVNDSEESIIGSSSTDVDAVVTNSIDLRKSLRGNLLITANVEVDDVRLLDVNLDSVLLVGSKAFNRQKKVAIIGYEVSEFIKEEMKKPYESCTRNKESQNWQHYWREASSSRSSRKCCQGKRCHRG